MAKSGSGVATGACTYLANSHRLSAIGNATRTSAASGNTTAAITGGQTYYGYGYDGGGRLTILRVNGQTVGAYTVNALGERVMKVAAIFNALARPLNLVDPLGLDPSGHDYRHVPYYPYGMWTDPDQAQVYHNGHKSVSGYGWTWARHRTWRDYGNEPHIQHTMPRQ